MAELNYGPIGDEPADDLPRTLRRERDAREREARERDTRERALNPMLTGGVSGTSAAGADNRLSHSQSQSQSLQSDGYGSSAADMGYADPYASGAIADMPFPALVKRFDVPFIHLVGFFLKAVVAAIPALILLTVILWLGGLALKTFLPELLQMKILISFPNS